jgi:phosphatidylserine decarboxylase
MDASAITYFNRYTHRLETEDVYGEAFLRFTYGNPLGRLALHALVKRAIFSRWYGRRMDDPASRRKVLPFISRYGVDAREFAEPPEAFETFNEFFFRRLRPGARPVDSRPEVAVFPADGRHLGYPNFAAANGIFIKGRKFCLADLLGDERLARRFEEGSLVISRLCPVDYHRFHFPVAGAAEPPQRIEGTLFSVNPVALRQNIRIFAENRRWLGRIHAPEFGEVLMLEIGATCVGATCYTFAPENPVSKGCEKGYFKFGGSSVISLFEPGRVTLDEDLVANTRHGRELYARMGDHMARKTSASAAGC